MKFSRKISLIQEVFIQIKPVENVKTCTFTYIFFICSTYRTPKDQISSKKAVCTYRQRFDIEGYNRFNKQNLLLDKLQTPDVATLDNWTLLVACAYWLLFVASDEVNANPKPWERYLPKIKEMMEYEQQQQQQQQPKKSAAQTKKAAFDLFCTFDNKAFAPKSVKNGNGRKKGHKLPVRPTYKVVRNSDFHNETRHNE